MTNLWCLQAGSGNGFGLYSLFPLHDNYEGDEVVLTHLFRWYQRLKLRIIIGATALLTGRCPGIWLTSGLLHVWSSRGEYFWLQNSSETFRWRHSGCPFFILSLVWRWRHTRGYVRERSAIKYWISATSKVSPCFIFTQINRHSDRWSDDDNEYHDSVGRIQFKS